MVESLKPGSARSKNVLPLVEYGFASKKSENYEKLIEHLGLTRLTKWTDLGLECFSRPTLRGASLGMLQPSLAHEHPYHLP